MTEQTKKAPSNLLLRVATAVVGAFFTEWSGSTGRERALRVVPSLGLGNGGMQMGMLGSF